MTGGHRDLDVMARRVIDANHYMTLGTIDPDGRPRPSPVYYTALVGVCVGAEGGPRNRVHMWDVFSRTPAGPGQNADNHTP
jgi:hypothetical protein